MGGGSTSSSSPGSSSRADSDTNASLRALRKEHEALKSSSCAQIQDLTRRNNSLSAARVQLENELSEAYRISSTSVKSSRQTIRALAGAADSAWSEVDTLKMENTRLVAEVEWLTAYKQRSEILLKQSQDTLESTRQLAYTRIQHLTNEHATKLSDQKFETDKLIRDANRRVLDKSMECRTLSQRIQGVQEAAQAQISGMRNELAQAKMMTEQFSTRDWDLAQSSAHLTNTPAHVSPRLSSELIHRTNVPLRRQCESAISMWPQRRHGLQNTGRSGNSAKPLLAGAIHFWGSGRCF